MHILILSANTGGGHNSAAAAITEELQRRGIASDTADCLAFLSEKTSEFISWGHSYVYKNMPRLFGKAYNYEERHPSPLIPSSMALGVQKFYDTICANEYDAIICVHVFAAALVEEARRKYAIALPYYFVATDYTCSPFVGELHADAWFIPHKELKGEFVCAGADADRIVPSGIPVRRAFYDPMSQLDARRHLKLPTDGRIVLLCCGSIGCGKLDRVVPDYIDQLPEDTTLVVVCGRNRRLYQHLRELNMPRTVIVGFTTQIEKYMAAADLCVSKPGGLSTTEMLVSALPMVLMLAVPGCETYNLEFMQSRGVAVGASTWDEALQNVLSLIKDPERLTDMKRRLETLRPDCAAETIVSYLQDHTTRY